MGESADSLRWLVEAVAESPARINERIGAGMMVGRYRLLTAIGRGGFGVVFEAVDTELGRRIALKLLGSQRRGEAAEARLMREAQAMARLSHPNVITVYDVGSFDGGVFIAMELVDGGTLAGWLAQPRPWRRVVELFLRAGRGLAAAHRAGLVHRDFKPENVLVGRDEQVRVTDFGVARMTDAAGDAGAATGGDARVAPSLTRSGALLGTPAYMAPEQMDGAGSDARADLFSFCVALWEALYGARPFRGATVEELRAAIAVGRLPEAPAVARVPARIRRVLARGLRAAPAERPQTMDELLDGLEAALRAGPRRRLAAIAVAALAIVAVIGVRWELRPASTAPPRPAVAAPTPPAVAPPPIAAPAVVPAPPAKGTIVVRVNVANARIELDGAVVAESAQTARVTVDAARDHALRVSAPGYLPARRRLRVGPDATVESPVTLARAERPAPPAAAADPPPAPSPPRDPNAAIDPYRP